MSESLTADHIQPWWQRWEEVIDAVIILVVAALLAYSAWLVFEVVPNERIMGPVQRIFYFHVGSAIAVYCSVAIVLVGSIGFLGTRKKIWDLASEAGAEVGFMLSTVVLLSGMIWARPIWNTWFHWEPRLVSFLVLWLIFLALNLLRHFGDPARTPQHCAVLGVLGAITVPIVIYSIRLLPQMAQLHPRVVENRGVADPLMRSTLGLTTLAVVMFQFALVYFRTRIGLVRSQLFEPS